MRIYISGQVTGLEQTTYLKNFESAYRQLLSCGLSPHQIVNPVVDLGLDTDTPWDKAMQVCLEALKGCTAIYMLYNWKFSIGARLEVMKARELGLKVYYEQNNDLQLIRFLNHKSTLL